VHTEEGDPVATGGAPQLRLVGFSGWVLEVFRGPSGTFVRKTVRDRSDADKLRSEVRKLEELATVGRATGLFRVPELLATGTDRHGLAHYDMEFVPSRQLDHVVPGLDPMDIHDAAGRLYGIVCALGEHAAGDVPARDGPDAGDFLLAKLRQTDRALAARASPSPALRRLAAAYRDRVDGLAIDGSVASGGETFCHGDLALDNVLVARDGTFVVVDPLANGHESVRWDVAKVLQSSFACWRQIKEGDFELDLDRDKVRVRVPERMSLFHERFQELAGKDHQADVLVLYLAVTLARVIKYSNADEQVCALLLLTNDLLEQYRRGECDLHEPPGSLRW
jgi:hypothetical protein